jgi:CYTH domain-containing protein
MTDLPKYSKIEIERRWLVDLSAVDLEAVPYREIEDLYIADSRLRLRRVIADDKVTFKLCKKYGRRTLWSEPITNLYLTEVEYRRFAALAGHRSLKRRYSLAQGSLDVYQEPHPGLAIFEAEFADEPAAASFTPPNFVTREITAEPQFSGAALAGGASAG